MKMKEFGPPGGRASLAPPLRSANDNGQERPYFFTFLLLVIWQIYYLRTSQNVVVFLGACYVNFVSS